MSTGRVSFTRPSIKRRKSQDAACVLEPLTEADEYEIPKASFGSRLAWAAVWTFGVLLMLFLVAVIVYVEFFYKWSFPLRVDCNLDGSLDITRCLKRGCKYVVTDDKLPVCFFPPDYGYVKSGPIHFTPKGFELRALRHTDEPLFGKEYSDIQIRVSYETSTRLRLRVAPYNESRFEPSIISPPGRSGPPPPTSDLSYHVSCQEGSPLGIKVVRKDTGTVIFDSAIPGMVLSEQFMQISTRTATDNVYGLGQGSRLNLMRDRLWKNWTLFSKSAAEDGVPHYPGVHPFYLVVENDGRAHGVMLVNSNAMDVTAQPEKVLTFRTVGGIFDFYIFVGSSPADVLQQYTELVGRPFMPPLWALGTHLKLRAGTKDLSTVPGLLEDLRKQGLPVEAVHVQKGYVSGRQYQPSTSNAVRRLRSDLKAVGVKVLLRADPIISLHDKSGADEDFLIKTVNISDDFVEDVAFVDFSGPKAVDRWSERCRQLYDDLGYDGLVLEANEPSYPPHLHREACLKNKWNYPPFSPGGLKDLFRGSVCGDSLQSAGRHYDLHNAYGHMHAQTTWKSMRGILPKTRPVIASRSTFLGSGRYAGHLHRPSRCSWEALRESIVQVLQLSLFGIPYSGSEIPSATGCSQELRSRWLQVAAFFPFFAFELPQQKADLLTIPNMTSWTTKARYWLRPYLYTLFYKASTEGFPVIRPLFYEFPRDVGSHGIDHQFLWGPAILVSPAIYEGTDETPVYFPPGVWYDMRTGEKIVAEEGRTTKQSAVSSNPTLHIRGGYIVPIQLSNANSEKNLSLAIFAAPDQGGFAAGDIFVDDGSTYTENIMQTPSLRTSFKLTRDVSSYFLSIKVEWNDLENSLEVAIDKVLLCGVPKPSRIQIGTMVLTTGAFEYNASAKVLQLRSLHLPPGNHTIRIESPEGIY